MGTIYTASSVADIQGYINGGGGYTRAVSGDTVQIIAGTFALTDMLVPLGGVTIKGAGLGATVLQLRAAGAGIHYHGTTDTTYWQDLDLDATLETAGGSGSYAVSADGGRHRWDRCHVFGPTVDASKLFGVLSAASAANVDVYDCELDHAGDDVVSHDGGAFASTSLLRFIRCNIHHSGPAANDQLFTAHTGGVIEGWYCTFTNPGGALIVPDATSSIDLYFCSIPNGGALRCQVRYADGLVMDNVLQFDVYGYAKRCVLTSVNGPSQCRVLTNGVLIDGLRVTGNGTTSYVYGVDVNMTLATSKATIRNCYITNYRNSGACGIRLAKGKADVYNNYLHYNLNALGYRKDLSNTVLDSVGNIFDSITGQVLKLLAGTTYTLTQTNDYNTYDTSAEGDYTPGANDTADVTPAIDATTYVPTATGNCDANGNAAKLQLGSMDLWGATRMLATARVCRGPAERTRADGIKAVAVVQV